MHSTSDTILRPSDIWGYENVDSSRRSSFSHPPRRCEYESRKRKTSAVFTNELEYQYVNSTTILDRHGAPAKKRKIKCK